MPVTSRSHPGVRSGVRVPGATERFRRVTSAPARVSPVPALGAPGVHALFVARTSNAWSVEVTPGGVSTPAGLRARRFRFAPV